MSKLKMERTASTVVQRSDGIYDVMASIIFILHLTVTALSEPVISSMRSCSGIKAVNSRCSVAAVVTSSGCLKM